MTKEVAWKKYYFSLFYIRLKELYEETLQLKEKDPHNFQNHEVSKIFSKVVHSIDNISHDPMNSRYLLGKSLGDKYKDWRRDKYDMPPRYRLFFKFFSTPEKELVYAWLNDAETLRKEGSRSDPYVLFRKMLDREEVPTEKEQLKSESHSCAPWEYS